jgi:hypothetical protein
MAGNFMSLRFLLLPAVLLLAGGCVQRTMTINSDPPGAVVVMNDQELGRTPLTKDFIWYGTYDVQVRMDGYETLSTRQRVIAPVWQWPPFDLAAELWPGHAKDQRHFFYTLKPISTTQVSPETMLARSAELRSKLESSQYTKFPATAPTTQPAK